jgi:hypothetical protein
VGGQFNAHINVSGTNPGAVVCDQPLPAGVAYNPTTRNFTGSCLNMDVPFIHCEGENACGSDDITIPVVPEAPEYGITIAKNVRSKDCIHPGQTTTTVIFDITVGNTSSVPIQANIDDPTVAACEASNIPIGVGGSYTHTCEAQYPVGQHQNIATATSDIDGQYLSASSMAEMSIEYCPQACDGVVAPTFNFTIQSENASTLTARSQLSYSGLGVYGAVNLVPVPSGGFLGGSVTSGTNYDSAFAKTSQQYTATASWQVIKAGEVCFSGSRDIVIQPAQGCDDFPAPTITLTPQTTLNSTSLIVSSITANPTLTGGVFSPTLPRTFTRPAAGQPAGNASFVYSGTFTPVTGLTCPASYNISIPVPPVEPVCSDYTPPTITLTPHTTLNTNTLVVSSITANPSGGVFSPTLPQTYTRPEWNQPAQTKTFVYTYDFVPPTTTLHCPVTKSVSVTVPPKDATCEQQHPPTGTLTVNHSGSNFIAHSDIFSTGVFDLYIYAWDNFSQCSPTATPQYEKRHVTRTLTCNVSNVLDTSYPWSGHSANGWKAQLKLGGSVIQDSGCINNNQNLVPPPGGLIDDRLVGNEAN